MWTDYPELRDRETLRRQLLAGKTIEQIARETGCTHGTVRVAIRNHNIRRPLIHYPDKTRQKLRL
ncbi:MAG: hypothetical protein LBL85_00465 [Methanocalculaceae archaeon]|jgi:DNA-binding CsgD family transcriptional regulator|nr:hypothetical protein [Methanocalculaceae archaeon]